MPVPEALSADELSAAKAYMRVEGDEEDVIIASMVQAAREYLARAGVALPAADDPRRRLYDLACHAVALSYYDQREVTITGAAVTDNPMLRGTINQLKLTEPVPNLGTSEGV